MARVLDGEACRGTRAENPGEEVSGHRRFCDGTASHSHDHRRQRWAGQRGLGLSAACCPLRRRLQVRHRRHLWRGTAIFSPHRSGFLSRVVNDRVQNAWLAQFGVLVCLGHHILSVACMLAKEEIQCCGVVAWTDPGHLYLGRRYGEARDLRVIQGEAGSSTIGDGGLGDDPPRG